MNRIYFAGSVGANDWRNTFATEADGRVMSMGHECYTTPSGGKFIYGGPFAICCDHGCFHLRGNHGSTTTGYVDAGEDGDNSPMDPETGSRSPQFVVNRCLTQIKNSHAVFAYVDKMDCFGTYAEIGYAHALGIPIFLYITPGINPPATVIPGDEDSGYSRLDELWFVRLLAKELPSLEIPSELLEFPSRQKYWAYLKSPAWKALSTRKRQEARNACQLCNATGELHVHHRSYVRIYAEQLDDLIVLCKNCHAKFHGKLPAEAGETHA